ncbi:hypothetical protein BU24DRAFT_420957 [Aaosphaeria arxii CBS 175.79]|uniref:PCI domain-containing protein n=1 Tax=Aaosphaeria arxii CBS 175.79 TaxID=1450172 RepID=A0A6A5XY74_9PLEO|nr:uncharacterized protein BU24DRAFT_420957 [Aaosphaeria arxii CBS 175.79]KAF2017906.1 hypothetical protein BU24DRAFT_420957 [Aaosphaeria arxii CBS 175.79]
MEQTRALNALEPFLALSKTATAPRAAADLITQATSAPNTYIFAELLQTPNIQNLRQSPEYTGHLALLEIFAWGTWEDYKRSSNLPQLTAPQHQKLLLLSLLPLSASHATLKYTHLLSSLDLPTTRALEDLLTTAIYSGLLSATLDPAHELVSVTSVAPLRDLAPGSLPALQERLAGWSQRCEDAVRDLEARVKEVKEGAVKREIEKRKRERAVDAVILSEKGDKDKRGTLAGEDSEMMDVDQDNGGGSGRTTRGSKKGPGGFGFAGLGRKLG